MGLVVSNPVTNYSYMPAFRTFILPAVQVRTVLAGPQLCDDFTTDHLRVRSKPHTPDNLKPGTMYHVEAPSILDSWLLARPSKA